MKRNTPHISSWQSHVRVNGRRLETQWLRTDARRDPEAPVLVFLHEGLGSIALWGDFPRAMVACTGLDGFLYDRLGHGRSDPLDRVGFDMTYQHDEAFEYLPAVLAASAISSCYLVGHSDGGTIALLYASRHADHVGGIITEAAHVFVDALTVDGIKKALHAYRHGDLRQKLVKYHGDKIDQIVTRWHDTWCASDFADWTIESILADVRCPVLAIQGREDEYGVPQQAIAIAEGVSGPGESWLVPDCRHIPHHQARTAVLDKCRAFIGKLEKRRRNNENPV